MKKYIHLVIITGLLSGSGVSCEKFLEYEQDNLLTEEEMLNDPSFYEGLLLHAYNAMPSATTFDSDIASDDAVTNDKDSEFLKMATGEWKSTFYPLSVWSGAYGEISYINAFLEKMDQVQWSWESEEEDTNYKQRLKGEAYGLRAWWMSRILEFHSGISESGDLLGFPIVTEVMTIDDEYQLARNSYSE